MNWCPGGTGCFRTVLFWCIAAWITKTGGEEISACYGDTVTISCGTGDKKINILGDFYGLSPPDADPRACTYSDHDICVIPSHSHSSVVKQVCNGRANCIFTISEKHTCTNSAKETTYQQIKYECIPESEIRSMCDDAEWSSHSGFLTSANYPIFYPPRASCTCTLHTEDASFILLKTAELRLKSSSPCRDYLRVEPALNPEEDLCGSVHRIYEARSFTLYFHTQLTSYKGFLLSYEASSVVKIRCFSGSPYTTTPATGTSNVTSPSLPDASTKSSTDRVEGRSSSLPPTDAGLVTPTNGGATYRPTEEVVPTFPADLSPSVKAPVISALHTVSGCFGDIVHFQCKDGEMIHIIQDMYGSAPSGRCAYEPGDCAVEAVGQKSIVSQICSSKTRCMNFIVTRTFCGERVTSYQEISYKCVPATALTDVCSETVITSSHGFLASPNFPGMYPRNLSCSCTLRAARGAQSPIVKLILAHFTLHDLMGCEDWLEVDLGDGNPPRTLCGSQHGQFTGTSIHLDFKSDAKYSHSGFWLNFEGENDTMIVIACNVPVELVWPDDITSSPSTTTTTATTTTTTSISTPSIPSSELAMFHMGDNTTKKAKMAVGAESEQQILMQNATFLLSQNDVDKAVLSSVDLGKDSAEETKSAEVEEPSNEYNIQAGELLTDEEILSVEEEDEPINDTLPKMESASEMNEQNMSQDDVTTVRPAKPPIMTSSAGGVQRIRTGWIFMVCIVMLRG